jgi:hypothetical protein
MTLHHYRKSIAATLPLLVAGYAGGHAQQTTQYPTMPGACYSRVYINPVHGILPGGSVSVTGPVVYAIERISQQHRSTH